MTIFCGLIFEKGLNAIGFTSGLKTTLAEQVGLCLSRKNNYLKSDISQKMKN